MVKCKKCPIQDECRSMNETLRTEHKLLRKFWPKKYKVCPLRVLADDVYDRYSQRDKGGEVVVE